ncbi:MAG: N-6 DNA methylase [Thermoflexales bacterium]|nr:N-6 DNA methylase [Thermoflexales bacterium]
MGTFTEAKQNFDDTLGKSAILAQSLVPVDGQPKANIKLRGSDGKALEEYYKWQFVYALLHSGLYAQDYLGVEVRFPKGSSSSAPLKLDGAIFDSPDWLQHYNDYWAHRKAEDLQWLNDHLLGVIEFKRNNKHIDQVFTRQVKPAMREKDPSDAYVLGIYYDAGRLYLFHRRNGRYLRYDEAKNQKGDQSQLGDLTLHLPDPYIYVPSFNDLKNRVHRPSTIDRTSRAIQDLDVITSISTVQLQTALSDVLRALDKAGLVNQRGYQIIIQVFALKIFDEKRNEKMPAKKLEFYILDPEAHFSSLAEKPIQDFIQRMEHIWSEAEAQYQKILGDKAIDRQNPNHVRAVAAICQAFQDFSFVRSATSDLYQLVFYNFANTFKRDESAQFLTPLQVIEFLVQIVNPRDGETVFDPCCGIGDFLSLSYVHAQKKAQEWRLDDANIYGVDLDENMIMLATLNMLLNGDGEAKLFYKPDKGSILSKIAAVNPPQLVDLLPAYHKNGNWDNWPDTTKLLKFDVILTNPPFGKDRAYRPRNNTPDRQIVEMYETWSITRQIADAEDAFEARHTRGKSSKPKAKSTDALDLGVIFLENAYRCLKENGRMGIVLSNSIASINRWRRVREWLMERLRIVALFDLPPNVFAETGVNTTLIVAYKPPEDELKRLIQQDYSIFVRDIQNVGYEKRTRKRNVFFNKVYRIDEETFEIMTDAEGNPILDEDFPQALQDFREWALGQEETLQRLFLREA